MARFLARLAIVFFVISNVLPESCTAASSLHPRTIENVKFGRYNYGDAESLPKRQTGGTYPITGASGGTGLNGSIPVRPEIRQLEQDSEAWTLYILGLDMMQAANQDDPLSWYQIAGIHGRPFIPWDGVQATPGNEDNGYCTHVDVLFLTWHRPYLALVEQVLYSHIQYIAGLYPSGPIQDQYVAAAATFRMPYWDWAVAPPDGEPALPDSVGGSPYVAVDGPFGTQYIDNPLYSYTFSPLNSTELPDYPFSIYPSTLRYPTTSTSTAISQNPLVSQLLTANAPSLRTRLYNLLTTTTNFSTFSNEAWIASASAANPSASYDSIESLHDVIHGITGMGGHMTYIEYSAFDPIFFLHHTMIDRCFALWQALHPDSFVMPGTSEYGTFTTSPGQEEDASSPLTPFHKNAVGGFWDSDAVRTTDVFGYAYPETSVAAAAGGTNSTAMAASKVLAAVQTLYGSDSSTTTSSSSKTKKRQQQLRRPPGRIRRPIIRDSDADTNPEDTADDISSSPSSPDLHHLGRRRHPPSPHPNTTTTPTPHKKEYILNLLIPNQTALGSSSSFQIYIFLSPTPPSSTDPAATYPTNPGLVGMQCVFTRTGGGGGGFGASRPGAGNGKAGGGAGAGPGSGAGDVVKITASIPLTASVAKHFGLGAGPDHHEAVIAYLKTDLRYRVVVVDPAVGGVGAGAGTGTQIVSNSDERLEGLVVSVVSVDVMEGDGNGGDVGAMLPSWENVREEFEVDGSL